MQNDINHYVTCDRFRNVSFRQRLDLISKNIFWQQKTFKLIFEKTSFFEAQSPVVGSLLWELDIGKKDQASEFIKKAPRPGVYLDIQKRLEALRKDNNKFNNNSDGSPLPGPSPPTFNNFVPPPQYPLHRHHRRHLIHFNNHNIFHYHQHHRYLHLLYHHYLGKYQEWDHQLPKRNHWHILEKWQWQKQKQSMKKNRC